MKALGKWMLGAALAAATLGMGTAKANALGVHVAIGVGVPVVAPAPVVYGAPVAYAAPAAYIPSMPAPGYVWVGGYWNPYHVWVPGYWRGPRGYGHVVVGPRYGRGYYGPRHFRR